MKPVGQLFIALTSIVLIFSTSPLLAQGFRNPPQDAKAAGMGNAFVARADNASAIYYNPAGIAFLESPIAVDGNLGIIDARYKNETLDFRTDKRQFYIPNGFIATNLFNKYLSFGYGEFSEFGLGHTYDKFSPAAPITYYSSLKTMDNRFTWALRPPEPFDMASIGGGFDLVYGKLTNKSITDFGIFSSGIPSGEFGESRLFTDGHGFGWHMGGLLKLKRMHSLGISFASQVDLNTTGRLKISPVPASLSPYPELSIPTSTKFVLPMRITWGYNFKPVDWFKLECDLTWLKYSKFKSVSLDVDDPTGLIPNQVIDFDFQNSWVYALGAELGPFKGFSLRGGWSFIQTPVPSHAFNPMIPDSDRNVASMGLGYSYKNLSLDICYAAVAFSPRKINNNVGAPFTSINGRWTGFVNQILMGASYAL